jgi:AraC family transcriptional regulator
VARIYAATGHVTSGRWALFASELSTGLFHSFSPETLFEKWAAQEVADLAFVAPDGFETLDLAGGLYAVFLHQGPASQGATTFRYILETWLPSSGYVLDDRPHFELLGDKYRTDAPESEEEIWLPIKLC